MLYLQEAIEHARHIANHRFDAWRDGRWQTFVWGTAIGHERLERFDPIRAMRLRLEIEFAYAAPRPRRRGPLSQQPNLIAASTPFVGGFSPDAFRRDREHSNAKSRPAFGHVSNL